MAALTLHVEGNKVLNEKGERVRLTGVNACGLEWDSRHEHMLDTVYEVFANWNCNIVRIPLSQDRWFGKAPEQTGDGEEYRYRKIVDDIVKLASDFGKYIDLDLHWNNMGEWGQNIGQHYMPDNYSVDFWHNIAKKYANNPSVLFDIYNEPHDVTWELWRDGGTVVETIKKRDRQGKFTGEEKTFTYTAPGYQKLIEDIRAVGANNIIFAGGLDWAYDLRGIAKDKTTGECYALKDTSAGNGIIYDSHIYPIKEWDGINHDEKVLCIADDYPVMIGEIGIGAGEGEYGAIKRPTWLSDILDWIDKNKFHWMGWCLHTQAGPQMISDWNYTPTKYHGAVLKERFLSYPDTNAHLSRLPEKP
jgi:hypothetical protein